MRKKPLLASITFTAALVGGGVVGFLLGVPGVSQAQTTTVPATPPSTAAPAPDGSAPAAPDGGGTHDPKNCPNMGGESGRPDRGQGSSSGTNTGYRTDRAGYM